MVEDSLRCVVRIVVANYRLGPTKCLNQNASQSRFNEFAALRAGMATVRPIWYELSLGMSPRFGVAGSFWLGLHVKAWSAPSRWPQWKFEFLGRVQLISASDGRYLPRLSGIHNRNWLTI